MTDQYEQRIMKDIAAELKRAREVHTWPTDLVYGAAVVAEEAGELVRAALQYRFEDGKLDAVVEEAIHTAATAIRLLNSIDGGEE